VIRELESLRRADLADKPLCELCSLRAPAFWAWRYDDKAPIASRPHTSQEIRICSDCIVDAMLDGLASR
jgi:hypothetical protein